MDDEHTARRPRGRPRTEIDRDAVADAVARLFAEGGLSAVSIGNAAEMLDVSRATLYRTVPARHDLVGILFERKTAELTGRVIAALNSAGSGRDKLVALTGIQVEAAVEMRAYLPVFNDGGGMPDDVLRRWRVWSREYESIWADCVKLAMAEGVLQQDDPVIVTRFILGMCVWISRWYRTSEGFSTDQLAAAAVALIIPPSVR
jgi:AcrR family transcriptional regulator